MRTNDIPPVATRYLTTLVIASLALLTIRCGDGDGTGDDGAGGTSQSQPYRSCSGTADCEGNAPACSHPTTFFCDVNAHQCAYYLRKVSGCYCVEGVIRECPLEGGMGVQRCNENASGKTNWGACGTLSSVLGE
jgi:hypothetical protein